MDGSREYYAWWNNSEKDKYYKVKVKVTQCCPTLCDTMDYTVHGVGSCSLLQGIFSTQGSNPGLCTVDSLPAEPQGKSKNTGVGSLSFLQWSSQPRSWTGVSWIAGGFFTNWTIKETLCDITYMWN